MKLTSIESFSDGIIIEKRYVNTDTGEVLPADFIPGEHDKVDVFPQWELFIRAMFSDPEYSRIAVDGEISFRTVTRLETACNVVIGNPGSSPDLIIRFFNELINALPINKKPSVEAISKWRQLASLSMMEFTFSDDGLIVQE
jgi:hypothetical protein